MRRSRVTSLVEALADVIVGLVVPVATQIAVFPSPGCRRRSGRTRSPGGRAYCGVDRAELRAAEHYPRRRTIANRPQLT